LGIKQGASDKEIKDAYRELVKKYHPDRFRENPLYDLAEEKLAEVNEAYDYLMRDKKTGGRKSGFDSNYSEGTDSYAGNEIFSTVRVHLRNGEIYKAEQMLNMASDRGAEWYYLKGLVFMKKGWYDQAFGMVQNAVNMDPSNYEYRNTLNRMNSSNSAFRNNSYGRGYSQGPDMCTICSCLYCTDCLCDCLGGGC